MLFIFERLGILSPFPEIFGLWQVLEMQKFYGQKEQIVWEALYKMSVYEKCKRGLGHIFLPKNIYLQKYSIQNHRLYLYV